MLILLIVIVLELNFIQMFNKFYLLLLYPCLFFSNIHTALGSQDTLNVKSYGAKGDGKANDYFALLTAVEAVNERGGNCVLFFPEGSYVINVYNTAQKKYKDLEFKNCRDFTIVGSSAIINIDVSYHRSAEYLTDSKTRQIVRSNTYSIIPFFFNNCNGVLLSGFEVNGNVDKMSKDDKVAEAPSHLVKIWETENMTMENMYLHHAPSDGVYIGGGKRFSKNINLYNVTSSSNGRQGLSIVALRHATFNRCKFINTGFYTGKYGFHSPGAGVDIEPIRINIDGFKTGDIKFVDCRFENNIGGQIRNGKANSVDSVYFIRDTIIADSSDKKYQFVLGSGYSLVDSCYIDIGKGTLFSTSIKKSEKQYTAIVNSTIHIGNGGIVSTALGSNASVVKFINNKIYCKRQKDSNDPYFNFKPGNVQLTRNKIYLLKADYAKREQMIQMTDNRVKQNNNEILRY